MLKVPILDTGMMHIKCIVPEKPGKHLQFDYDWDMIIHSEHEYVFHTDKFILLNNDPRPNHVALITESYDMMPDVYNQLLNHEPLNKFKFVFTHWKPLLEKFENSRWISGGGIWCGSQYFGGPVKEYEKTKQVSFLTSNKRLTELHKTRYALANYISKFRKDVDIYGGFTGQRADGMEALGPYKFSIAIENGVKPGYFTEKLLNCFYTKTIPIYIGAPDIGEFFDYGGIIRCKNANEVLEALNDLPDYNSRLKSIEHNYQLCLQYEIPEDYIWEKYLNDAS